MIAFIVSELRDCACHACKGRHRRSLESLLIVKLTRVTVLERKYVVVAVVVLFTRRSAMTAAAFEPPPIIVL